MSETSSTPDDTSDEPQAKIRGKNLVKVRVGALRLELPVNLIRPEVHDPVMGRPHQRVMPCPAEGGEGNLPECGRRYQQVRVSQPRVSGSAAKRPKLMDESLCPSGQGEEEVPAPTLPEMQGSADREVPSLGQAEIQAELKRQQVLTHQGYATQQVELPSPLVEKIVAGMPFPYVVKARQLSREWKSKFHEVVRSSEWPLYCPVFFNGTRLLGYDKSSGSWHNLTMSATPPAVSDFSSTYSYGSRGVLICCLKYEKCEVSVIVMNLLTGKHRTILCPKTMPLMGQIFVIPEGQNDYKLLVSGYYADINLLRAWEYSSSGPRTWTVKSDNEEVLNGTSVDKYHQILHTDGMLYFTCQKDEVNLEYIGVARVHLHDGVSKKTPLVRLPFDDASIYSRLVTCGSRLLVVVAAKIYHRRCYGVGATVKMEAIVFELEMTSFTLVELSRSNSGAIYSPTREFNCCFDVVGDTKGIFICHRNIMTHYDIVSGVWTAYHVPDSYNRPPRERDASTKPPRMRCINFVHGINPYVVP